MHSWHNFTGGGGGRVNPLMGRKSLLKKKMKKKKKKKKRERERERAYVGKQLNRCLERV